MRWIAPLFAMCWILCAQSTRDVSTEAAIGPQFDVASVKPSQPSPRPIGGIFRKQGGPGTADPARISYRNFPLRELIMEAYGIDWTHLSAPAWLMSVSLIGNSDKFDIDAKLAPSATKDQCRVMLQNLLAERFGLKTHRESRSGPGYLLVVNKGGPKMKLSPELPPGEGVEEPVKLGPKGADGFPIVPTSHSGLFVNVETSQIRIKFMRRTMPEFAEWLWSQIKKPVFDRTELPGKYDFYLEHRRDDAPHVTQEGAAPANDSSGPDIFGAVQSQLGLKLTPGVGEFEMLIVDHVERTPTGN